MAFQGDRVVKLYIWLVVMGLLLVTRLAYLQIMEGHKLALQGLNGRIQEVPVEIVRGEILDRNGIPLTNTAQYYSVSVFPSQVSDAAATAALLSDLGGGDAEKIAARIRSDGRPFKLKTGIDAQTAQKINDRKIPGVIAVIERARYGSSPLGAHVVGYINSADNRGVSGIEGLYDESLRGSQPTYLAAMVDATQQIIPGLGYKRIKPPEGHGPQNIVLTIDSRLQKITENVMDQYIKKGAVVVLRPSTGEILAMASRPNFDADNLSDYLSNDASPLLNRAVLAYQPGSVFKLVVASAALEEKLVRPGDVFFDPGYVDVNNLRFKGWDYDRGGRGRITFEEALAYSSNPVFIQVGQKLGAEKLISYARKLGFGQKTSLDFDGEAGGNLAPPDTIYPGDLANLSIGQGSLEATPLQVACLVAAIVNDGIKVDPYLVVRLTAADGTVVKSYPVSRGSRVLSRQTAAEMRQMLGQVTRVGTGQEAYVEGWGSAGKTGTAETGRQSTKGQGVNHAWFAGYAPLDNPRLVMVVFVEDGMSGGDVAAPIFREIATKALSSTDF